MPLRRRRRLVRAAAVGGTAYMAGRHAGRAGAEEEYDEAPAPSAAPVAAEAPPTSDADRIKALKDLKDLLDAGAINQYEFDREKDRLLHADG
jgi:hypothetical protein